MVKKGWRRNGRQRVGFLFVMSLVSISGCGGPEPLDVIGTAPETSRGPTPTKTDSTSSYIDSPYQTGVSQGSATAAAIPPTLHMTPATLSFLVDREWATVGVSATLKVVNGTSRPARLDRFEITGVDGPLSGASRFFSFENTPSTVILAPGETHLITLVFRSSLARSVVGRLIVKSDQATNGELEAALYGKITSF